MNDQQTELYRQIQAFSLDNTQAPWPFSKKLARENRWSETFTLRVIEEYKKFAFLAVAAGHPVTPSDQVDQAWHLHLTYTRSYWEEFCPKVLGKPLHHEPTRGGQDEKGKFNDWYGNTLASYEKLFGHKPPEDIWPDSSIRFGKDLHHVRVNGRQYWLLPKPKSWRSVGWRGVTLLGVLVMPLFIVSCAGVVPDSINPMKFDAAGFLWFYGLSSLFFAIYSLYLRSVMSKPEVNGKPLDVTLTLEELAHLANGPQQAVDVALVSLLQRGSVELDKDNSSYCYWRPILKVIRPDEAQTPLEAAVLVHAAQPNATQKKIRNGDLSTAKQHSLRLEALGLYVPSNQLKKAQVRIGLLCMVLLIIGFVRVLHGLEIGKPVGYLIMIMFVLFFLGLSISFTRLCRSHYGDAVLDYEKRKNLNIDRTTSDGLLHLVATVGLTALAGTAFADVESALINSRSSVSGGAGSSGGDGGGGGCGGCGG